MAATEYYTLTQEVYISYFGRPADPRGLDAFATSLQNLNAPMDVAGLYEAYRTSAPGSGIRALLDGFGTSAESNALYGTNSTTGSFDYDSFVNAIFLNVLNRPPKLAGLNFYVNELTTGHLTKAGAAVAIMAGAFLNTSAEALVDQAVLINKAAVASNFTAEITTVEELIAYKGAAAAADGRTLLQNISGTTDVAAYQTAVVAALDKMVEDVAVRAGEIFTLGVTPDTIIGKAGNDTISGAVDTFTAFDSIDGGAGKDTLTILTTGTSLPNSATIKNVETINLNTTGAGYTLDTTAYTGTTALNIASSGTGTVSVTAANTTAVNASVLLGAVTVTGGSSVTTTNSTGAINLTGATGAINATQAVTAGTVNVVSGGTSVDVTETGITTGGSLTVGGTTAATRPTGAVNLNLTGSTTAATSNSVSVTGGTSVAIGDVITNSATTGTAVTGNISVTGSAVTNNVSVTQKATVAVAAAIGAITEVKNSAGEVTTAGVTAVSAIGGTTAGTVTIADVNAASTTAANTIATVTLNNYGAGSSIASNALTTLNLSGTAGTLAITNAAATVTNKTLALNLNNLSGTNTITDTNNEITTLNIAGGSVASTLAGVAATGVTALNVSGASKLTLSTAAGLTNLATVTVTGAGGVTTNVASNAQLTAFNAAGSSGTNTVTLDATKSTYTGGSGVDNVTISAVSTKAINGGAGSADVLTVNAASYAANALNTGFEGLAMGGAANGSFNAAGFTSLSAGAIGGASSFINVGAGVGLTITDAPGFAVTYTLANVSGTNDVLNLNLNASGASVAASVVAAGIETVNVTLADTVTTSHLQATETLTLSASSATSLNFMGTTPLKLALVNTDASVTSVDASGMTGAGAGFSWTAGAIAANSTIKGVAGDGTNSIDLSGTAGKVTYTGGTGVDNVVLANSYANTLNLGNGANTITGAATGNNTVTGGSGNDSFVTATIGNNNVSFGNGANAFTATSGNNTYTGGTGVDTVTVGLSAGTLGVNTITVGGAADVITLRGSSASQNLFTTITDIAVGDTLTFQNAGSALGTATFTTAMIANQGSTATFADYVNLAVQAVGDATTNSNFAWFQFNGNTYIVEDNSNSATFVNNVDAIVQLTGLVTVNGFSAVAATSGSFTFVAP